MVDRLTRRRLVQLAGGGLAITLAGCADESDDDNGGNGENGDNDGDDGDGPGSDGLVYAFGPDSVGIIDPADGELLETLEDEIDGREWGDPRITRDHSKIFVAEQSRDQLLVVDTEHREVEGWVDVGGGPTHIYNPVEGEIWAHADDEGTFYVVDTEELDVIDQVDVLEDGGHGKLLTHETLGDVGYAMNVDAPAVTRIDLEERTADGTIELGDTGGTHYKAYAPETGYLYAEWTGHGTAVIDTETDDVVDELEYGGGMYLSPDDELLGVIDGEEIHFVDATSEDSDVIDTVDVEGEPAALRFYESDDGLYAFTANAETPDASIIDVDEMTETDRIDAGGIDGRYRAGIAGDEYFVTPADADGTVTIIDMEARELVETVEVADGVDTVQYVGDSGVGYTSE